MEAKGISAAQIKMIYGLARKCAMDDDTLHGMVEGITRASSIKALTSYQASKVIERLKTSTGQETYMPADRATDAQRRKIFALARALGWMEEPKRLRGFLEARFHVADVAFLPASKVGPVIEALKAMADGGRGERRTGNG